MPPTPKHVMVQHVQRLRRAVSAHAAVREGIATQVQKESDKRAAVLDRKQAVDKLTPPKTTLRHEVFTRTVVRRDQRTRLLGGNLVCGSWLPPARDLC
jgi:hypothetical protein